MICSSCGKDTDKPFVWWEKDGLHKSLKPVEGWRQCCNCPDCLAFGYEMAEVMG